MNKRIYSSLLILALLGMPSLMAMASPIHPVTARIMGIRALPVTKLNTPHLAKTTPSAPPKPAAQPSLIEYLLGGPIPSAPPKPVAFAGGAHGTIVYKGKSNNAEDVKYLQAYLKKEVGLTDDQIKQDGFGTFGENTDNALMKKFGYKNHGNSVGTKTWGKIGTEDLSTQIKAIDTALNAPVVVATKELAAVTLTDTDLSGVGLELSLDSDGIHLKGTLPAKCVKDGSIQRLALSPVRVDEPSIDDSEEAANLADRASKLSVSATFTGQEVDGMKNLADCKTKATPSDATTPVDLVATFQDPENGAILVSNNKTLKSKRLLALESLLANCPDCSAAQHRKKLNTILDLENSSYEATAKAHLEAMISDAASTIDNASSLADLEKARNDLISYSSDATRLKGGRDEMLSSIQTQLQRIIDKNEALAKKSGDCGKKTSRSVFGQTSSCATPSEHADFAAKTWNEAARLKGLTSAQRDAVRQEADKYKPGSLERVKFIANIDPVNDEVTDAIQNGRDDLRAASMDVRRECAFLNPRTFASCNQAKQSYLDLAKTYQDLYQNYSANTYMGQQFQMQSPFGMGGYMGPAQFAPGMSGGFYPMGGFQNAGMNGMMMNSPFMMNGMQQMNSPFMMNGMQQMNNPFMMNGMQQNPMMAGQFNSPMAMGNGFNGLQVNTGFNMMR